jgi:hypothetical protein
MIEACPGSIQLDAIRQCATIAAYTTLKRNERLLYKFYNTVREGNMGIAQEFKAFAIKGSVVDLAIGVIIGGAFGKIVDSLVQDIIMPIVGRISFH